MFNIKKVGDGYGIFCAQPIPSASSVLEESALSVVPVSDGNMMWDLACKILTSGRYSFVKDLYSETVSNAPSITKTMIKSLAPAFSKPMILRAYYIVCRNAYMIRNFLTFHQRGLGLYPIISRFNHHCDPNCILVFDGTIGKIISIRDLAVGEELTVSYHLLASSSLPLAFRHKLIMKHYDFKCHCSDCRVSSLEFSEGDLKIMEILENSPLDARIINLCRIVKSDHPTIRLVIAVLCLRSFLDTGCEIKNAIFCNDQIIQSLETIQDVPMSYLRWYAEYLFTLILEVDHPSHRFNRLLLKNDIANTPALANLKLL